MAFKGVNIQTDDIRGYNSPRSVTGSLQGLYLSPRKIKLSELGQQCKQAIKSMNADFKEAEKRIENLKNKLSQFETPQQQDIQDYDKENLQKMQTILAKWKHKNTEKPTITYSNHKKQKKMMYQAFTEQ